MKQTRLYSLFCFSLLMIVIYSASFLSSSFAYHPFRSKIDFQKTNPFIALSQEVDGASAWSYVENLVSEEYAGRLSGTEGADKAAEWIAQQFHLFGLTPGGNKELSSYYQPFEVPLYKVLSPTHFHLVDQEQQVKFNYGKDYAVMPLSGSGKSHGQVVFAGYGIKEEEYNDFDSIDLHGKIALIIRRAPKFKDFSESNQYFSSKVDLARDHGAKGVLMVDLPGESYPYNMKMKHVRGTLGDIPVFFISPEAASIVFHGTSYNLALLTEKIEKEKRPASIVLDAVISMETNIHVSQELTSNIIGFFPARMPTDESILIVAHYDHLGLDQINLTHYAGANDNASGTGTLIELARALTYHCYTSDINIVFIAFSGEEIGLMGSFHYVKHPLFPLPGIKAVFNMDMVGTGTGSLYAGTSMQAYPELYKAVESSAESLSIQVVFEERLLRSGSDHFPFHRESIPNVFFIRSNPSGIGGYHTPQDTLDTVDPKNLEETGRIILMSIMHISEPLFMVIDSEDWKNREIQKPYLVIQGLGNYAFNVEINRQKVIEGQHARFFHLLPLSNGINLVHITLSIDQTIVYEKFYQLIANIIPALAADFNSDGRVDLLDLRFFSLHFGKQASHQMEKWIVCDLNSDGIIDQEDLNIFQQYYGYRSD